MGGINMKQFNLEEYLANPRKVITRDGRNARIICTDAKNNYPIVALIEMPNGRERQPCGYKEDGTYIIGERLSCYDLFFAPEKHEGWLNIYRSESGFYLRGTPYKTKEEAEEVAKANYKNFCTTVKIEWEE